MIKHPRILLFALMLVLLTGCDAGRSIKARYPQLLYYNSSSNFDKFNRKIQIEDGFILDEGHSYDVVKTDGGYDVVLHFVPMDGGADNE